MLNWPIQSQLNKKIFSHLYSECVFLSLYVWPFISLCWHVTFSGAEDWWNLLKFSQDPVKACIDFTHANPDNNSTDTKRLQSSGSCVSDCVCVSFAAAGLSLVWDQQEALVGIGNYSAFKYRINAPTSEFSSQVCWVFFNYSHFGSCAVQNKIHL